MPQLHGVSFEMANSPQEAVKGKDACLLITPWKDFETITPQLLYTKMRTPLVIDGRGFFRKKDVCTQCTYVGIGMGKAMPIR